MTKIQISRIHHAGPLVASLAEALVMMRERIQRDLSGCEYFVDVTDYGVRLIRQHPISDCSDLADALDIISERRFFDSPDVSYRFKIVEDSENAECTR